MKVKDLMQGRTPKPEYQGLVQADDFVLGIDFEGDTDHPDDYLLAQEGSRSTRVH